MIYGDFWVLYFFHFKNFLRNQLGGNYSFIQEFIESGLRSLDRVTQEKLSIEYQRNVRTSSNIYKKIVYVIMGKFEVDFDASMVVPKTEDFLWFALHQINSQEASGRDLSMLQNVLKNSLGESYFKAQNQPITYFWVLLLSLQFESAIAFLASCNQSKLK